MASYSIILTLAGIIAGLIQYFVDFKGLPLFQPLNANLTQVEDTTGTGKLYKFIKDHWQLFGYLVIGIAGSFLTPLLNELTNNRLPGLDSIKEYAKCISLQKDGVPSCSTPSFWYYLILFGYGIIFGYTSVRVIRNIGSLILGNVSLKQDELQKKLENAQKQIDELKQIVEKLLAK